MIYKITRRPLKITSQKEEGGEFILNQEITYFSLYNSKIIYGVGKERREFVVYYGIDDIYIDGIRKKINF